MAELAPVKMRQTGDGSQTLFHPELEVCYHSVHGAWTETQHVFGDMGVEAAWARKPEGALQILEVGLGTGLNVVDVWSRARASGRPVVMVSLEPHPLTWPEVEPLGHDQWVPESRPLLEAIHIHGAWSDAHMTFERRLSGVLEAPLEERRFDVILFDAFAPASQPEIWTSEVMDRMRCLLRPGGHLVTYCAKGQVRRNMESAGFQVERLPGPPGKREMLRATRVHAPEGRLNVRVYMVLTRNHDGDAMQEILVSYERLPMGGVMKFPGGGLEWGEGTAACLRREALEELGQRVEVGELLHVSQNAHVSSFDSNQQVIAVHHLATLPDAIKFDDAGEKEDVQGQKVALMAQRLGWRKVDSLVPEDFEFASDREAWRAFLQGLK